MSTSLSCVSSTCVRLTKMTFQLSLVTFYIFLCIFAIYSTQTNLELNRKSNTSHTNNRSKRFLISQGGGVLKIVLGFSQPMDLLDKHPYRQLALSYGFHFQYNPPTEPVYWWTYFVNNNAWAHATISARQRRPKNLPASHSNGETRAHCGTFVQRHYRQPAIGYDVSRFAVYKAIETVFNSKGLPGERCLLRAICAISQQPLYENNAIHGIINTIFSPTVANIDGKYLHAKQIGVHGIDCERIYWGCKEGIKWMEQVSYYL